MLKIKKGDTVTVRAGKDKGKNGKVLTVEPDKNRVIVEKINIIKKHVKSNPQKGIKGGKLEKEGAIPLAKVMYFCQNCGQGVRVGFKLSEKGDKVRVCKKCGTTLD